jgi:NAD(P)-dependent dehydrogenase (short-subunit alcohol dehydrogenase family)
MGGARWIRPLAAGGVGLVLGAGLMVGGALLLYGERGFLGSAGALVAAGLISTAAGVWVGAPDGPAPGHQRTLGRWMFAVAALVIASFAASFWIRAETIQMTRWGGPLALVLLLAEPAYAAGALLAALEARRRAWLGERWYALRSTDGRAGGVAVPAMVGAALGAAAAGGWLIPAYPPGMVFMGLALVLTAAGSLEMALTSDGEARMSDRVVVVTGVGDRGQVGYAVAEGYVEEGARVVVTSRSEAIHDRARALGDEVVGVAADLADAAGAEAVVAAAEERWGRIDVLVNVAGGLHVMESVESTSPEAWQREVDSNVLTAFLMSRAALPLLRESHGSIVNFASPAGLRAVGGMAAYSAGKAGVVALTRSLAKEEKENGVRVNAIAPGMIDTAQNRESVSDPESVDWVRREEVVDVVRFLASDEGAGVNGETVKVLGKGL